MARMEPDRSPAPGDGSKQMEDSALMNRFLPLAVMAGLSLGLGMPGTAAHAAPASAAPMIGAVATGADAGLLEEVRYATRCRPTVVYRRDRRGRPVQVRREVCRRVWVGRGR